MNDYPCVILANPRGRAWPLAVSVYEGLRKRNDCQYELNQVNASRFNDQELMDRVKHNVRKREVFFIHDSSLHPDSWLSHLLFVNQILKNSSAVNITDVLPYLPYSRQDRKHKSREPLSAGLIANHIRMSGGRRVITVDVHNPAIESAYAQEPNSVVFTNLYSFPTVVDHLNAHEPELVRTLNAAGSPDAGGAERTESFGGRFGLEIIVATKARGGPGKIKKLRIGEDLTGKNVIWIDDMFDTCGTIITAAQEARRRGANKVYAYATHALFTKGIDRIVEEFDLVLTSDTIPQKKKVLEHPKIRVIPIAGLLEEAIWKVYHGESIEELYDK